MMKSILRFAAVLAMCLPMVAMADRARVFQAEEIIGADGAAWLKRTQKRVDGRIMARVSMANTPYTIWWVIFNKPKNCLSSPCGLDLNEDGFPDDFQFDGGAAADIAVFNAGGAISSASGAMDGTGVINLNVSARTGDAAGNGSQMGLDFPWYMRDFNKRNGLKAEIHLVIDKHDCDDPDDCDWVTELTYQEVSEAFAVFAPVARGDNDDDSDSD